MFKQALIGTVLLAACAILYQYFKAAKLEFKQLEQVHDFENAAALVHRQTVELIQAAKERGERAYPDFKPEVFRAPNKAIAKIPAFQKFNKEYLIQNIEKLEGVFAHKNKVFVHYDVRQPLTDAITREYENKKRDPRFDSSKEISLFHTVHDTHMDPKEFFDAVAHETDSSTYHYLSQSVQKLGKTISDDILPYLKDLKTSNVSSFVNLWVGGRGSTAQAHYDSMHNMYIQVKGQKRFKLFSPTAHRSLYMFPYLHPCQRQCQINMDYVDYSRYPEYETIQENEMYEVVLGPGDMLYIPPFWFHHVEALGQEPSISFNVFTECLEEQRLARMLQQPIPFLQDTQLSYNERIQYTSYIITFTIWDLLHHELGDDAKFNLHDYVEEVVLYRYRPIMSAKLLPSSMNCGTGKKLQTLDVFDYRHQIVGLAMSVSPRIRDIIMGHWIEHVTSQGVGAENVGAFLDHCL